MSSFERTLRKLAIGDDEFIDSVLAEKAANLASSQLDQKTHALVRLASMIAVDAAAASYMSSIESARRVGATDEEIVGCLVAVMPTLGPVHVVSAAPKLALALGYDVAAALEGSDVPVDDSMT